MFSFQADSVGKQNHRKTHFFDYKNGMAIVNSRGEDGPQRILPRATPRVGGGPAAGDTLGSTIPAFVALDGKVLRFDGYFMDPVDEMEEFRVRRCVIYYYLVDDSVRIAEPRTENSGIPQGSFLKRHKIPWPQGGFLHWTQLSVGASIRIYGRDFNLTGCDDFTRDFMLQNDLPQAPSEDIPRDPYMAHREATKPGQRNGSVDVQDRRWRFQQFNRKVLRFFCQWDDRENLHGENRTFTLHYFMEDQTMEIFETRGANSGRDGFSRLLKRQRLPKQYQALSDMENKNIYTDADLRVGETISVFGRNFLLYDCDDATKSFLREVYDVQEFPDLKSTIREAKAPLARMAEPPYTGYGTPEDSLGSFYNLVPKVPRKPMGRDHLDGKMLRWMAKFKSGSCSAEDEARRFVITNYLADDTISIFEPPIKNSGMLSGKFLERSAIYKRGAKMGRGDKYTSKDFSIGGFLEVHSHIFELVDCDEYTKKFMATGKAKPIAANHLDDLHGQIRTLLTKRKAVVLQRFRERDASGEGRVSGEDTIAILRQFIEVDDGVIGPFFGFWGVGAPGSDGTIDYIEFIDLMS